LIRHAQGGSTLPVGFLTVAMIELTFYALLMTEVCGPSLLATPFATAEVAAILLSPVAGAADPERNATTLSPAKPLTQNDFGCSFHSRPKARLDISRQSWQPKSI
jgi:hypothetical protein